MSPRRTTDDPAWHNSVELRGRLSAAPEPVELPSGDPLWRFRVSVPRPEALRPASGRVVVDAVDCSTTAEKLVARLERAQVGAVVEVSGVLTRRFWRAAGVPTSRYEVVVDRVRVAARRAAAS